MNIVEPVLFQCKLNPLTTAICVPGSPLGPVTYGQLEAFIHNVARTALRAGMRPGALVATYVSDTALHTALVLGLIHAGAVTLSLRGTSPVPGIKPDLVLTDIPGSFPPGATVLAVDQSWLEGDGAKSPIAAQGRDDDICRIILTSGSTGAPKGMAFSHGLLAARLAHYTYSKGPRFAHCSRFFCDLSVATSPGFRYALSLLSRGGTIFFLGPDPADILQTIDLHKIGGMSTSPYGLGEFLKFFEADSAFQTSFDHIICQGAMLSRSLAQRARARMCQNLYSSYGSTETTTVAFGNANVLEAIPGAVGYVQPGVTVEIVDETDQALPLGHDGLLRIRSAHMVDNYVGDPATTQIFFRNGFFYSGDNGHLTPEGILVITGRQKTALNIGGDTVSPEVVEEVAHGFPGVRDAAVFATENDLGVAELTLLLVESSKVDQTALLRYCAQALPPSCVPTRVYRVGSLPRGTQGKLDRQKLPQFATEWSSP